MRNKIETDLLISELIYKYLNGDISKDEQEILNSWIENDENTEFFYSLKDTDRLYKGLIRTEYQDIDAQFRKLKKRIEKKKRARLWPWGVSFAASLVIALGIHFVRMSGESRPGMSIPFEETLDFAQEDQTILHTPDGKVIYLADSVKEIEAARQKAKPLLVVKKQPLVSAGIKYNTLTTSSRGKIEVMLSDSSRVWMNAGSELRYPDIFDKDKRIVYLKGEAYFEVTKNSDRPFIVSTGSSEIEVLGTQFNVRSADGMHCVTTLVEGCVKMRNQENQVVVLNPGQQAEEGYDGKIKVKEVDVRYDIAWKKNQFGFHEVTLLYIMNELSEWYGFTFEIENIALANQTYTAIVPRYPHADDVLQILQCTEDFVYVQNADRHIIIKKNNPIY